VLIIWGYGLARREPVVLYGPPFWTRYVTAVLMLSRARHLRPATTLSS
jgi:hypothetical protein